MTVQESPLVELAEGARRPSRWWLAWLIVMAIIIFVPPLGIALGNAVLDAPVRTDVSYPYVAGFGSAVTLLALAIWLRFKEGRAFATVGFRPGPGWLRLLVGFGIGAGLVTLGVVLGLLAGVYGNNQSTHTLTGADAVLPLLPLVLLSLFQAGCQAALVPGYLLQTSARQLPGWVAIIGTSILVAVLESLDPVTVLNLFLYAMFIALVSLQQGSLWLVVGIQAGWTCCQAGVFGLPIGGIAAPTALLSIGSVPGAPTLVSGGRFGLETSLLATGVLVVAVVFAYRALRRTTATGVPVSASARP